MDALSTEFLTAASGIVGAAQIGLSPAAPYWVIGGVDRFTIVNLDTGETFRRTLLEIAQSSVEDDLNHLDGGTGNLRVFHFAVGGDAGIAEAIDSFIAKRSDDFPSFVAVNHSEMGKYAAQGVLQAAYAAHEILNVGQLHVLPVALD